MASKIRFLGHQRNTVWQITGIGNTTSTPVPGVPHNYITGLSEVVNPSNGALSIRIKVPTPHERGANWPTYAFFYDSNGQFNLVPTWVTNESGNEHFTAVTTLTLEGATPSSVVEETATLSTQIQTGQNSYTTYGCQVTYGMVYTDPMAETWTWIGIGNTDARWV